MHLNHCVVKVGHPFVTEDSDGGAVLVEGGEALFAVWAASSALAVRGVWGAW